MGLPEQAEGDVQGCPQRLGDRKPNGEHVAGNRGAVDSSVADHIPSPLSVG